ncbi:unnamed protein product [Lactuca saligna]|uniref:Uncharacterized protein n=1 Tax=Lactuca saligna TaxID=75948 RepID=A0AA36A3A9_LACSI|nr:unnamed protein product [Lactuca saligna]
MTLADRGRTFVRALKIIVPTQILYKLPTSPEYLFQEESIAQWCSWGKNLTYYTIIGYLSDVVVGIGKGLVEGMKDSEARDTIKLMVIWNEMRGGWISGWIVVGGLVTRALYKTTAGPRSVAVAGAIGGIAVGLPVTGK